MHFWKGDLGKSQIDSQENKYEHFKMKPQETFVEMHSQFLSIKKSLESLRKVFSKSSYFET